MYATHYEAAVARLEADPRLLGKVFDVVRQNDGEFVRAGYLVVTVGVSELVADRQGGGQIPNDNAVFDFKVRAVNTTADGVMSLLDAVSARWVGWVPQIVGRRCSAMRYPRQSVDVVFDATARLFYADVEYTLRSNFSSLS